MAKTASAFAAQSTGNQVSRLTAALAETTMQPALRVWAGSEGRRPGRHAGGWSTGIAAGRVPKPGHGQAQTERGKAGAMDA